MKISMYARSLLISMDHSLISGCRRMAKGRIKYLGGLTTSPLLIPTENSLAIQKSAVKSLKASVEDTSQPSNSKNLILAQLNSRNPSDPYFHYWIFVFSVFLGYLNDFEYVSPDPLFMRSKWVVEH